MLTQPILNIGKLDLKKIVDFKVILKSWLSFYTHPCNFGQVAKQPILVTRDLNDTGIISNKLFRTIQDATLLLHYP